MTFKIPNKAQQQIAEEAGMAGPITWFSGDYRFLSNFYECSVEYDGKVYPSAEHAFQAAKTTDPLYGQQIRQALTPKHAKQLGRELPPPVFRKDWDAVRVKVMEGVVLAKFSQHPNLQEKLLATGDRELIEGNHHGDSYWGVYKGEGENWLGKILVRTREYLRGF